MSMTKSKAIFVGCFAAVFAGGIVFLLFNQIGIEGSGPLHEALAIAPLAVGLGVGAQVMAQLLKRCVRSKATHESGR